MTDAFGTHDVRATRVVNPHTGAAQTIGAEAETITVDPGTGSRSFQRAEDRCLTHDGTAPIDPATTPLFWCACCGNGPFSVYAVLRCHCGRAACKAMCITDDGTACRACTPDPPRWRRVFTWLRDTF
jgi:hypothetical protein